MSLRDEINEVRQQNHGKLTPEILLDAARAEDHPLHSRFTWDDSVAAERWRRHEAHRLIRAVRIRVVADDEESSFRVRSFVAVPSDNGHSYVYEPVEDVAQDPVISAIVLREAQRAWVQLRERYSHLEEFLDMVRRDVVEAGDGS